MRDLMHIAAIPPGGARFQPASRFSTGLWILRAAVLLMTSGGLATAALVTAPSGIPAPTAVINFSQFSGSNSMTTKGPVDVGAPAGRSVIFTSTNPDGSQLGSNFYTLGDNGTWGGAIAFAGLDVDLFGNDRFTMTFRFNSGPVSAVGGLVNYSVFPNSGFGDATIAALSSTGTVLESFDLNTMAPISTPGGTNAGAFRGIARSSADISAFTLSNSAIAITNLTFTAAAIPEPASVLLLGTGFGLLLTLRRR